MADRSSIEPSSASFVQSILRTMHILAHIYTTYYAQILYSVCPKMTRSQGRVSIGDVDSNLRGLTF